MNMPNKNSPHVSGHYALGSTHALWLPFGIVFPLLHGQPAFINPYKETPRQTNRSPTFQGNNSPISTNFSHQGTAGFGPWLNLLEGSILGFLIVDPQPLSSTPLVLFSRPTGVVPQNPQKTPRQ